MRLHILSDLHLEFRSFACPDVGADVTILAGDIHTGSRGLGFAANTTGKHVLYVMGNHEFYGDSLPRLTEKMREETAGARVHILENDSITIGDVRFLGCTLWTDFAVMQPRYSVRSAMSEVGGRMSDYQMIRFSPQYRRLRPKDTLELHVRSRQWLAEQFRQPFNGKTVVITHHGPVPESTAPAHRSHLICACFVSDLRELVEQSGAALWVHGHTHHCVDTMIGATRLLSNQRGYPDENTGGFKEDLTIEI